MKINECIMLLSSLWNCEKGVSKNVLESVEQVTGFKLPQDYKKFMQWSNGGGGVLKKIRLSFWPAEDLVSLNEDYKINKYLGKKVLAIGSDGGPICLLLDYRGNNDEPCFSSVNFGDLDPGEIKVIAPKFTLALELAIAGEIVGDDL